MKKQTLLFLFVALFNACSKEKEITVQYPKTELVNTTWKTFSFTGQLSKEDVYKFIHFVNTTTVEIYTADITGSKLVGIKNIYPCKINLSNINADSFEVTYPNAKVGAGFTTSDVRLIRYDTNDYVKVN